MCTDNIIIILPIIYYPLVAPNFFSAAGIISMHYESILARCGSVGIAVATSPISRGKTNCAKVSTAMCGNYPKGCTGIYITM